MQNNTSLIKPGQSQGPNGKNIKKAPISVKLLKNILFKKDELLEIIKKKNLASLKFLMQEKKIIELKKSHLSALKKLYLENITLAFEFMLMLGKSASTTGAIKSSKLNELKKKELNQILNKAVKKDSIYRIFEAISKGADINIKTDDYANKPLIIYASIYGSLKVAEILINLGADVNHKDTFRYNGGWTPVFFTSSNGNLEMLKLFVKYNANINEKDSFGKTPFHWAVSENKKEIIQFLIKMKADLNVKSNDGITPLKLAKIKGYEHQEIAFILEKNNAIE